MTSQVVTEAIGHDSTLTHYINRRRHELFDFRHQNRIVRTCQHHCIDVLTPAYQRVDILFDEIVGTRRVCLTIFDQWHPHRAWLTIDGNRLVELCDLKFVATTVDSAGRTHNADMATLTHADNLFDRRAYDAKHATRWVDRREVVLLNSAQRFGRGRVASQYDQLTALRKKITHGLERKLIDHIEGARTVGGSRIVAEIEVVIVGEHSSYLLEYRQSAIAGVKHSDWTNRR